MAEQPERDWKIRHEISAKRRGAVERYSLAAEQRRLADKERRAGKALRTRETVQRAGAADERVRAARARQQARAQGDPADKECERLAELRERDADERDRLADLREARADQRDRHADARQRAADLRDLAANSRDRLADSRDAAADKRDQVALRYHARLIRLQGRISQVATHYYQMSSVHTIEAAMRDLIQDGHHTPTRLLGYTNRHILRVDHPPGRRPDASILDIDPKARRLPEPPADPN